MKLRVLACLMTAALLSGCAAGLGERLDVEELVDIVDPAPGAPQSGERWIRVNQFTDSRSDEELVLIDGRRVLPLGLPAARVTRAFQDLARLRGYRVSQHHGPLLQGEVIEWIADVKPSFPVSHGKASAAVKITALDPDGRALYAATYYGDAEMSHPMLTESRIKTMLSTAMETALEAALKDAALQEAVGY